MIINAIVIPANLACRQVGAGISKIKMIPHQVWNDTKKIINQTKPVVLSEVKKLIDFNDEILHPNKVGFRMTAIINKHMGHISLFTFDD